MTEDWHLNLCASMHAITCTTLLPLCPPPAVKQELEPHNDTWRHVTASGCSNKYAFDMGYLVDGTTDHG